MGRESEKIKSCIVSILSKGGEIVGAGFLVSRRHVITCAHVVAQSLSIPEDNPEMPLDKVYIEFPFIEEGKDVISKRIICKVIIWRPLSKVHERGSDIALLELDTDAPSGSQPGQLIRGNDLWGHSFRAFGFPTEHDSGVWATGVIRAEQADGLVEIEGDKPTGFPIMEGFSGAPVWDDQAKGIVGMVVTAEESSEIKAAFIIPTDILAEVCGCLITRKHKILSVNKVLKFGGLIIVFLLFIMLLIRAFPKSIVKKLDQDILTGKWKYHSLEHNNRFKEWSIFKDRDKLSIKIFAEDEKKPLKLHYVHESGEFSFSFNIPMTTGPPEILEVRGKILDNGYKIEGVWDSQGLSDNFILFRIQQ